MCYKLWRDLLWCSFHTEFLPSVDLSSKKFFWAQDSFIVLHISLDHFCTCFYKKTNAAVGYIHIRTSSKSCVDVFRSRYIGKNLHSIHSQCIQCSGGVGISNWWVRHSFVRYKLPPFDFKKAIFFVFILNLAKNWWVREPISKNWWVWPNPSNPC